MQNSLSLRLVEPLEKAVGSGRGGHITRIEPEPAVTPCTSSSCKTRAVARTMLCLGVPDGTGPTHWGVHVIQPEDAVFDGAETPHPNGDMKDLARLADSLVEHLAETRRHYEQLREDLDSVGPLTTLETPTMDEPADDRADDEDDPDRARLLALNLALTGWDADDVRAELREKCPYADAEEIIEGVFPEPPPEEKPKRRFLRRRRRA
jgi:hypothetical protein